MMVLTGEPDEPFSWNKLFMRASTTPPTFGGALTDINQRIHLVLSHSVMRELDHQAQTDGKLKKRIHLQFRPNQGEKSFLAEARVLHMVETLSMNDSAAAVVEASIATAREVYSTQSIL
jgi:hypothetical protein